MTPATANQDVISPTARPRRGLQTRQHSAKRFDPYTPACYKNELCAAPVTGYGCCLLLECRFAAVGPRRSEAFPPLLEVATCNKSGKPSPKRPERRIRGKMVCRKHLARRDMRLISWFQRRLTDAYLARGL